MYKERQGSWRGLVGKNGSKGEEGRMRRECEEKMTRFYYMCVCINVYETQGILTEKRIDWVWHSEWQGWETAIDFVGLDTLIPHILGVHSCVCLLVCVHVYMCLCTCARVCRGQRTTQLWFFRCHLHFHTSHIFLQPQALCLQGELPAAMLPSGSF